MARSLKKGPFADEHLLKKVDKLNESNKKEVISLVLLDTLSLYIMEKSLFQFM